MKSPNLQFDSVSQGRSLSLAALTLALAACSPVSFQSAPLDTVSGSYSNFFDLGVSESNFQQAQLETNKTSVAFQVLDSNGNHVQDLKAQDFLLTENSISVSSFKLNSNSKKIVQTVDIVFSVDITGSMTTTIERAKARLISFINKSRANGVHSRMCVVTFGDYTVKKCDRFYDNDPSNPATEVQVKELISEISKLKALQGVNDPGGSDLNENPMRALIDSSLAPWSPDSQRFVILITDDGFLYSPGNSGTVGALAPQYSEVVSAITKSQIKVFAATPSLPGYNSNFMGSPGVVALSGGEWFSFDKLIDGSITLDTILDRILNRVQTTYMAEYTVDETSGLDPSLPLSQRKILISMKTGLSYTVNVQSLQSNLPNGRESYKKKWKLAGGSKIKKDTAEVRVNSTIMTSGFRITDDDEIEFDQAPSANSKIEVRFQYKLIRDGITLAPVRLPGSTMIEYVRVFFNDAAANPRDYSFTATSDGAYSMEFSDRVFDESDPYRIRASHGLKVEVIRR